MATIHLPFGFKIDHPQIGKQLREPGKEPAPLGVLAKLSGSFNGTGLNTIFRPNSGPPPLGTSFPKEVTPLPPKFPSDNVLELNLTAETITFTQPLSKIANRGFGSQEDIFLNGKAYMQTVNDVANIENGGRDGYPVGIHFETGIWMNIPPTKNTPVLPDSLVRMASIPHGTTINAQCLVPISTFSGPPHFSPVDLRPFTIGEVTTKQNLNALNVSNADTPRIPQDLSKFVAAGTITQAILSDPNTVLRDAIQGQNITQTIVFTVSTSPPPPEFGGGAANIAFLVGAGDPTTQGPNGNAFRMDATFWIETVEYSLEVPVHKPGQAPMEIHAPALKSGQPGPVFLVNPPHEITSPKTITVTSIQIQYSQVVFMNFDQLTWPHVSVSTLIPAAPVPVPDSVWE
ncbi:hypothetical protein N7486_000368 [Penicillium sp. IBT 16267x]|nr:hypothetical protein N7486_000368 [Penicillium sp. IBT 16267x]